jgi:hypothetical protein
MTWSTDAATKFEPTKPDDGGPAFPAKAANGYGPDGMSLRDWFAGQAVAALIARHRADVAWGDIAPTAYATADAMLKARGR